jgi:alpha-L-fucosidase 2
MILSSAILQNCIEAPLNISFDTPAEMWEETLPLGNGRLGAMPNGGILKETLVLNEETMWSGSEWDPANPDAQKWLPLIRQKLLEGDNLGAEELVLEHFTCSGGGGTNPRYGNYQTLGNITIDFSEMKFDEKTVTEYSRWLSLNEALSKTIFSFEYEGKKAKFYREYFVSIPENAIVVYLKTENAPLKFSYKLNRKERAEIENKDGISTMKGILNSGDEEKEGVRYFSEAKTFRKNDNEAIIFISAATNYKKIINNEKHNEYETIINEVEFSFIKSLTISLYISI